MIIPGAQQLGLKYFIRLYTEVSLKDNYNHDTDYDHKDEDESSSNKDYDFVLPDDSRKNDSYYETGFDKLRQLQNKIFNIDLSSLLEIKGLSQEEKLNILIKIQDLQQCLDDILVKKVYKKSIDSDFCNLERNNSINSPNSYRDYDDLQKKLNEMVLNTNFNRNY